MTDQSSCSAYKKKIRVLGSKFSWIISLALVFFSLNYVFSYRGIALYTLNDMQPQSRKTEMKYVCIKSRVM